MLSKVKCFVPVMILLFHVIYMEPKFEACGTVYCEPHEFQCWPSGICCLKDSHFCSNKSESCDNVFTKGENKHEVCCKALSTNNTTRKGLIESCIHRLGSDTWSNYCKEKYLLKFQPETTTISTDFVTTMASTQDQQNNVTSKNDSTTNGSNPLIIVCVILSVLCLCQFIFFLRSKICKLFQRCKTRMTKMLTHRTNLLTRSGNESEQQPPENQDTTFKDSQALENVEALNENQKNEEQQPPENQDTTFKDSQALENVEALNENQKNEDNQHDLNIHDRHVYESVSRDALNAAPPRADQSGNHGEEAPVLVDAVAQEQSKEDDDDNHEDAREYDLFIHR